MLVATPVGAGEVDELYSLDGAEVDEVRTTAEVGETAAVVERDGAVLEVLNKLDLIDLFAVTKDLESLSLRHFTTGDGSLGLNELHHFLLDLGEVLAGDLVFAEVDVVIETVLDGRSDTEFYAGVEFLQSRSKKVGGGVPEGMLALFVVPGKELNCCILVDRTIEFYYLVVDFSREDVAGQTFADAFSDVEGRYAGFILADGAVGEGDIYHNILLFQQTIFIHSKLAQKKLQHI